MISVKVKDGVNGNIAKVDNEGAIHVIAHPHPPLTEYVESLPFRGKFTNSAGVTNMNVNGSVTPQIFGIRNPAGSDIPLAIDITRLMFVGLTTSTPTLAQFGNIAALARGIQVRKVDGEWHNVFNAKTNAEMKNIMYDFEIQAAASQAQDGFTGRFTLTNLGAVVRIGANEDLQIIIQDNLTALTKFEIIAEGSEVVD